MPKAEDIFSMTVCKQAGRYIGWPTAAQTGAGEILVVFSGDRDAHVCPFGKTQLVRSRDRGRTWSEPETINDTPLDDRDAGIIVLRSGAILVSWFTSLAFESDEVLSRLSEGDQQRWNRRTAAISAEDRKRWLGSWTRRSADGAWTWDDPVRAAGSAPHGPIQLSDGRLLYLGRALHGEPSVLAEESRSEGRSWRVIGKVPIPEGHDIAHFHEPHVAELPDGNLVGLLRYHPPDGSQSFLEQTESEDGGKTWSPAHTTPMWGYPPHLTSLKDGRLLATYGCRREPYGQRACLSSDGGLTWSVDNEIVIRDDGPSGDLGYPASIEMDDGTILTVYYQQEQEGEKTCLMATCWWLPQ